MHKNLYLCLLVAVAFLVSVGAYAQNTVSGRVTSAEAGEGLPGVNVLLKGTSSGTVTDIDGNYSISADSEGILVFSSIGYITQEIPVNNRSTINLQLETDVQSLSEVVVVGYGTQNKRDITGAISTVKAEELSNFKAAPSLDQALQGQATGVQVSSTSGVPGAPTRVLIRGTNSISSGTEPLWIIDGMILSGQGGGEQGGLGRNSATVGQNPLASINPNDIESVEVLKDASATAIYGSRGANGVIIVTTKSGKGGKGTTDLSVNYGITNPVRGPNEIGFVDGPTWLSLVDEARANRGLPEFDPNALLNDARDPTAVLDRSQIANTNWFDEALRQGSFMDINLSTSNATEKTNYYLSGNYREDRSILEGGRLRRYATRANVDFYPAKNFSVGSRIALSYTNNQRAPNGGAPGGNSNIARGGYNMANSNALPILPIFHPTIRDPEGNPILFDPLSGRNLRATINRDNYINDLETYRAIGGLNLDYKIPFVEGLSVRSELSFDFQHASSIEWGNTVIREGSKYAFDNGTTFRRLNYNLSGTWNRDFGNIHNINLVAGAESTEQQTRRRNTEAQELFGEAQDLGSPGDVQRVSNGLGGEQYFRGFFGRFNYKLMDRYILGFSFRRDASSIFLPENRWNNFLAASAGWIISDESFMQNVTPVEFLKLRASFGQTGNSAINALATETGYTGWGRYGDVGAGDLLSRIGNPDLLWETTNAYDVGLDFELYGSRISGSIGYYLQDATDLLLSVQVPQSSGIWSGNPTIVDNIGDLRNQGWEFTLNTINIDRGGFQWSTNFNFTTNRNEVLKLTGGEDEELYNVRTNGLVTTVGESLGYFRLAEYAGIDPVGGYELIYEMDLERFRETGERVRTGNVIPATRANLRAHLFDQRDKTGLPTFFGGLTNNFRYKGLELSAVLVFSGGNYIYDNAERQRSYIGNGNSILRQSIVGNTWTEGNPNAEWPQLSWNHRYDVINEDGTISENQRFDNQRNGQVHDKFLKRGDFLRMRTLQLAYNLPSTLMERWNMSGIRVYVSANNLFTITEFDGYDPEVVNLGNDRNLGQGWVGTTLPQVRSWNVGATFSI
ncbi:MAG: SusC/RagA family TonB-linked outer membrane protein [Cyclobacteriaceae bacterium]